MMDPKIRHAEHELARWIGDGRPKLGTFAIQVSSLSTT
jgi:hypothetical protein